MVSQLLRESSCFMVEKVDPNGLFLRQRVTTRHVVEGWWEPTVHLYLMP